MAGNVDWKVDVETENIMLALDGVIKLGFARVFIELYPVSIKILWAKTIMWKIQIIKENPENILLFRVVKLFNFGSARVISELFPVCKKIVKMQCRTIKAVACMNIHD